MTEGPTETHTTARVVRRRRPGGFLLACLVALVIAVAVAYSAEQARAAPLTNPSPFRVERSGDSYTATSQVMDLQYVGTLKSVVETAVADLNAFPEGGTITFSAGRFDLGSDSFVLRDVHDIVFEGQGIDQTLIENVNNDLADSEPFNLNTATNITIKDMTISAGGTERSTSDAIDFDNGSYSTVDNVRIVASRGRGIIFDGKGDAGRGIPWTADYNVVGNCQISGTQSVAGDGIEFLASNHNEVYGCTITDVVNNGINVAKASPDAYLAHKPSNDNYIHDNTIVGAARHGIMVNSSSANRIEGNTIINSGRTVAADGIRIDVTDGVASDRNSVSGNFATDNQAAPTQQFGLNIADPLCAGTVVGANDLDGNAEEPIQDLGTGTVYLADTLPFADGFESGDLSRWTHNYGLVAQSAVVSAGSWAAEARVVNSTTGAYARKQLSPSKTDAYFAARFRVATLPASGTGNLYLLRFRNDLAAASPIAGLYVTPASRLGINVQTTAGQSTTTSAAVVALNEWHTVQLHVVVAGTGSRTEVWLDGVPVPDLAKTDIDLGTTPIGRLELGSPATGTPMSFDVFFDVVRAAGSYIDEADITPPAAPTGLVADAVVGGTQIDLTWEPATGNVGVAGYRVYRDGVKVNAVDVATTSYSDMTVVPATGYTYTVTAVDAAGNESAPSAPALVTSAADTVVPQPPTTLTATAASHTQVTLSWSGASDNVGVTSYRIFRNGAATPVATVGASPTTYTDGGLTPATTYSYTIAAEDAAGNVSAMSVTAEATTPVFSDGFESGNLSHWTSSAAFLVQTANVASGTWAGEARSNKNTASYAIKQLDRPYTGLTYSVRFMLVSGKRDTVDVLALRTQSGGGLLSLYYDSSRRLAVRNEVTRQATTSTTALKVGVWYELKVRLTVGATAPTGSFQVWLNGAGIPALTKTGVNFGVTPIGQLVAGETATGHAYDYAIDDVLAVK